MKPEKDVSLLGVSLSGSGFDGVEIWELAAFLCAR
jgi:hypothetical protein